MRLSKLIRAEVWCFGITTTAVQDYDDKERVHSFLATLQALIGNCQERLDAEALEQAQKCEKFKAEGPELEELVEFETAKARLDALNSQLDELGPVSKRTVPVYVSASTIYAGFLGVVFAAIRGFDSNDSYVVLSLTLAGVFVPAGGTDVLGKNTA